MEDKEKRAVLRNYGNPDSPNYNDIYMHMDGDVYKNLRTLKEGTISPELVCKVLKINVNASFLINEYPMISEMVHRLGLRLDVNN